MLLLGCALWRHRHALYRRWWSTGIFAVYRWASHLFWLWCGICQRYLLYKWQAIRRFNQTRTKKILHSTNFELILPRARCPIRYSFVGPVTGLLIFLLLVTLGLPYKAKGNTCHGQHHHHPFKKFHVWKNRGMNISCMIISNSCMAWFFRSRNFHR